MLETSEKTPQLIGLSVDFDPSYEIIGDKAFFRCNQLNAVDIVDEGAITHGGLFLKPGVDKEEKDKTGASSDKLSTSSTMATEDKKEPTLAECMAAITALAQKVTAMEARLPKAEADDDDDESDADGELAKLKKQLGTLNETVTTMKREKDALGLNRGGKGDDAGKGGNADSAAETERARLAAEKGAGEKSYLELVSEKATSAKLKKSDAHSLVQRENPKAYEAHLLSKGVIKK